MYQVYLVINQISEKVYVGLTGMTIKERFYYHEYGAFHGSDQYFHNAIRKLGGLRLFSIHVLNVVETLEEAEYREKFWIKYFKANDRKFGYNLTSGGIGLRDPSKEVRQKLSRASSSRRMSEETKAHLSKLFSGEGNPNYGKKHTDGARRKIREAGLGRTHTDESKKKMSLSRLGEKHPNFRKPADPERLEKMNSARLSKGVSDETRKKMSEATRGEKNPNFGKKHSPEAKSKISAAQKKAHASRKLLKTETALGPCLENEQTLDPSGVLLVVGPS
jgi:group I intron endonuclease